MLNWIVWNRTVCLYKNGFGIKYPAKVDPNKQTNTLTNNSISVVCLHTV